MAQNEQPTIQSLDQLDMLRATYKERMLTPEEDLSEESSPDMTYAGWSIAVPDMNALPNEEFAMNRKYGLGGSDASTVLGANPFKTRLQLIEEKARDYLTEEEKGISSLVAVQKGVDLEPLIIKKFAQYFNLPTYKPKGMYYNLKFPYLKMNFDGIAGNPEAYIPSEAKVVTAKGERHYNPSRAIFTEQLGMCQLPENITIRNASIEQKAAHYGLPPAYYCQLQQEMFASGASYGFLSALFDKNWKFYTFFAHRDERLIADIVVEGWKVWQQIVRLNPSRAKNV